MSENHLTERVSRFEKVVLSSTQGFAIIITQVDPDAIGSALGLAYLLKKLRSKNDVIIYYCGTISHPQNKTAMVKYNLSEIMQPIKNWKGDARHVALVDSSRITDGRLGFKLESKPLIVIDHHRDRDIFEDETSFVWVEDVGSACTMVAELFIGLRIDFRGLDLVIPTLLSLGIRTDTDNLLRGSRRDRRAQSAVEDVIDEQDLRQLYNYPLPPSYFRNLQFALTEVKQKSARIVTNIGTVLSEVGDDVSTIADLLIRQDGVSMVVVWCLLDKEKVVRLSARNTDNSRDLGLFLRERLGPSCGAKVTEDGKGIGGGSLTLDFGFWLNIDTRKQAEELVGAYISSAVFRD